jgi:hypothetical protein
MALKEMAYYRGFISTEVLSARVVVVWPVRRNSNEGVAEKIWEYVGKKKKKLA